MKLSEWLLEPEEAKDLELPDEVPDPPTRLAGYACLVALNGGSGRVTGWGVHGGGGLYGSTGLTQGQAFALTALQSFVQGMLHATAFEEQAWLIEALKTEWSRVRSSRPTPERPR
jgi:hypothetical protein